MTAPDLDVERLTSLLAYARESRDAYAATLDRLQYLVDVANEWRPVVSRDEGECFPAVVVDDLIENLRTALEGDRLMTTDDLPEYRVEFSITRRLPGEDDFTEVGFGSSGAWDTISQASHMAASAIEAREWETEPGMPNPGEVEAKP